MSKKLIFETYLTKDRVKQYDVMLTDLYRQIVETAAGVGGIGLAEQERGPSLILLSMLCQSISIEQSLTSKTQAKPSLWETMFRSNPRRINRYDARRFYNTTVRQLNMVRSKAGMEHVLYCGDL